MSEIRKVVSFAPIEIAVKCIDKKSVCEIEVAAINAVKQKLDKLNILLKNLTVYCHDNVLLVNDRYGICKDLEEIASAFGFIIQAVDCSLRGKTYILQDTLIKLISATNTSFSIANYANSQITPELISVIEKACSQSGVDVDVAKLLREVKEKGYFTLNGKQRITTVYDDDKMIRQDKGKILSNKTQVAAGLKSYLTQAQASVNQANEHLRDGTVKLLYYRARQMGYAVKEERCGSQVQLVLVRCG